MIGYFAVNKETTSWKPLCITDNISKAYHNYITYDGCFIDAKKSDRGEYFHVFTEQKMLTLKQKRLFMILF